MNIGNRLRHYWILFKTLVYVGIDWCREHREIVSYIFFGGLTTVVDWAVSFGLYTTSMNTHLIHVIAWVAAVLFAFFTNRKWVFTDADKNASVPLQLVKFSGGRIATFFIDYAVTLFGAMGLAALVPAMTAVTLFGREWNFAEIGAKVIAAVIVIVCNYIFSKLFVFKNKK